MVAIKVCANRDCPTQPQPWDNRLPLPIRIMVDDHIERFCSWACTAAYTTDKAFSDAYGDLIWEEIKARRK